jgi:hypothetical protein
MVLGIFTTGGDFIVRLTFYQRALSTFFSRESRMTDEHNWRMFGI